MKLVGDDDIFCALKGPRRDARRAAPPLGPDVIMDPLPPPVMAELLRELGRLCAERDYRLARGGRR